MTESDRADYELLVELLADWACDITARIVRRPEEFSLEAARMIYKELLGIEPEDG